jgi:hypothetical protein
MGANSEYKDIIVHILANPHILQSIALLYFING